MKLLATLLITVVMVAHAVLGCCAHHEHHAAAAHESLSAHHDCEGDHHHSEAPGEPPCQPQDCDEGNCVFMASKHTDLQTLSFQVSCLPLALQKAPKLSSQDVSLACIASEDAIHPEGVRLRIWLCIWVI